MKTKAFDWAGLMRLGLGSLRLSPESFWSMTPAELRLALEGAGFLTVGGALPMDRARLADLMADFPDRETVDLEDKE
ncbi:MAG: rcc01693 family protein [Pseudomonadota bacterium]